MNNPNNKQNNKNSVPTPILRSLQDPIGQHIMPSRSSLSSTERPVSSSSSLALTLVPSNTNIPSSSMITPSSTTDKNTNISLLRSQQTNNFSSSPPQQLMMLPPPARQPRKTAKDVMNDNRLVLTEDAYQKGLEHIIEHTYYPHLQSLQAQLQWLQALETRDPVIIAETRSRLANRNPSSVELNRDESVVRLPPPEWGGSSTSSIHRTTTTTTNAPSSSSLQGSRITLLDNYNDYPHPRSSESLLTAAKKTIPTTVISASSGNNDDYYYDEEDNDDDKVSLASWSADIPNHKDRQPKKRLRTTNGDSCNLHRNKEHEENDDADADDRFSTFTMTDNRSTNNDSNPNIIENMSLTSFQNAFTTEDSKSFETNFQNQQDKKQRQHWWAHIPVTSQAKILMLHDRSANRIVPENKSMETIINNNNNDHPPHHHHHVRNSLFFLPSLDQSNTISQVNYPKPNLDLPLLTNKPQSMDDSIIVDIDSQVRRTTSADLTADHSLSHRTGSSGSSIVSHIENSTRYHGMDLIIPIPNKNQAITKSTQLTVIHYDRTRIPDTQPKHNNNNHEKENSPRTSTTHHNYGSARMLSGVNQRNGSSKTNTDDEYGYVSTPALVAGVNITPIITWGEVSGTPIILDPPLLLPPKHPSTEENSSTSIRSPSLNSIGNGSSNTVFSTRAEDLAKQAGIDLRTSSSALFTSSSILNKNQQSRDEAHQTLVQNINDARQRRAEKAGTLMSTSGSMDPNRSSSTPNVVFTATPNTVALTRAHLRQAIAEAQLMKATPRINSGTTPSLLSTHQTTTPLFASSMTPSAWTYSHETKRFSQNSSAESIVSSRSHHSSVSQRSTASSTAASLLRTLPPTARKMATSIATNVAKEKGLDSRAGDLSGVFSNPKKRSR